MYMCVLYVECVCACAVFGVSTVGVLANATEYNATEHVTFCQPCPQPCLVGA